MPNICDEFAFSSAINSFSVVIASKFESETELADVAAVFSQIGETLNSIVAQRALKIKKCGKSNDIEVI